MQKKLIILGGGYGGLKIAKKLLDNDVPDDVEITLVDRMPFQGLKTEYYALVAGMVNDMELRVPFPEDARLHLHYGEVTNVDLHARTIDFADGNTLSYDQLIIGLGCVDNYHNTPGAEQFACTIQTMGAARTTYQKINNVAPYGQITIVGGGLSGVEIAAELRESRADLKIRIMDHGPSILAAFPEKLQVFVRDWFTKNDIEMIHHAAIQRVEAQSIRNGEQIIPTDATIWTAGIQPSHIVQKLDVPKDKQGRILLNEQYQMAAYPEVYVVGDCANLPFSPSAQAAESQGEQIAEVIQAVWKGAPMPNLKTMKLKGTLGSLGSGTGFGVLGNRALMGKVPRLLKSGVLWMYKHHLG